jgi:methyl-accepting chemotaxis protein
MDETTQQNAALAEQTSAASVAMSERASDMSNRLGFFEMGNNWGSSKPKVQPKKVVDPSSHSQPARAENELSKKAEVSDLKADQPSDIKAQRKPLAETGKDKVIKIPEKVEISFDDDDWEEF